MSDMISTPSAGPRRAVGRLLVKRIVAVFALIFILDVVLFLSAGRLDWPAAWVFSSLYCIYLLIAMVWGTLKDPDLLKERSKRADNVKSWDKVIMGIYTLLLVAMLILAGLDAGRFGWSAMPLAAQVIGLLGLVPAGAMNFWAATANTYLSRMVRIQEDRGHQVISSGPYRYVRHPMYVSVILLMVCIPLLLGSWWALIPGGLIVILFVIRTALEDRTLQAELPGYAEYAQRVHYRLLPGVW
jgi:protein-S-isoprenylcysteine O-methyltransferase Ste14